MNRILKYILIGLLLCTLLLMALVAASVVGLSTWLAGHGDVTVNIDGQTFQLGTLSAMHTAWAALGLAIALVVCLVVIPVGLLLGLALPVLVIVAVFLGVLLPIGVIMLSPLLLILWLVWLRRRKREVPAAATAHLQS